MQLGAKTGTGFDIAENIIGQAKGYGQNGRYQKLLFCFMQYLDIDEQYHNCFDFILFTIGAITWFEDLQPALFKSVGLPEARRHFVNP